MLATFHFCVGFFFWPHFNCSGSHMRPVAAILDMDIEHFPHCRKFWWTELADSPPCTSHLLPPFLFVTTKAETFLIRSAITPITPNIMASIQVSCVYHRMASVPGSKVPLLPLAGHRLLWLPSPRLICGFLSVASLECRCSQSPGATWLPHVGLKLNATGAKQII